MMDGRGSYRTRGASGTEFGRFAIFVVLLVLTFDGVVPAPGPWHPPFTQAVTAAERGQPR